MKKIILLFFLFLFISNAGHTQEFSSGSSSADTLSEHRKPAPVRIVDINFELERTRKKLVKIVYELEPDAQISNLDSLIVEQQTFLMNELDELKQFNPNNLSKYFLENTYRAWNGYESDLVKWKTFINNRIAHIQNHINELEFNKRVWELTMEEAASADTPAELQAHITELIREIKDVKMNFLSFRQKLILMEDDITELISITDDVQEEVSQLQQHLRDNLFKADKPVLWKVKFNSSEIIPVTPRIRKAWHENAKTVTNFSKEVRYYYLLLALVLVILLYFFIINRFRKLDLTDSDPHFVVVKRIFFDHPYSSLTFFIIVLFITLFVNMPLIMIGILGTVLLFCSLFFLPHVVGLQAKRIINIALVLYILNLFEILFWYFGNYARIYVTAESTVALFLIYKYGIAGFKKWKKDVHSFVKLFRVLSTVLFLLFSIAFLSSLFGFMNLAVLTLKIGVKTVAIVVIIFSAYIILRTIILAVVEIGRSNDYRLMTNRWDKLEKRSIQLLKILAVFFLIKFMFQTMEIYRPVMNWLRSFLEHEWEIGTLQISIGGVLSLILILAITFGISSFIKIIIEDEILVHTKLPKGVPAAISVTIRYFIITLGVLMALGAAGIDLGKFGLLAGALGVGIGFGLQNIVNNFISGLILVYERPVNVGDTIEVENLMGTVNRIGIRSSNVRTYDGAEVVVPNGNLISNQLINWTLSDNKRRVELKVGTAYGTDPNVVLELLKKVAMNHEDVLKTPEPRALFEEFGDSSLNFRLLFWVPFEMGIGAKSDIAIGVYNIFEENNIEIPFPQVDLHVKKEDENQVKGSDATSDKTPSDPIEASESETGPDK